jgi:hypothetical protein
MDQQLTNRDGFIRYLLGEIGAEEQEQVEKSFADEDTFFDFILIEDQLIVDYLNGRLTERQRELFQRNYLTASNERREQVALAQSLMDHAGEWETSGGGEAGEEHETASATTEQPRGARVRRFILVPQFALALAALIVAFVVLLNQRRQITALEEQLRAEQRGFQQQQQDAELSRQAEELLRQRAELEELRAQYEELKRDRDELARVIETYKRDPGAERATGQPERPELASLPPMDVALDGSGGRGGNTPFRPSIKRGRSVNLYLKQSGTLYESYSARLEREDAPGSPKEFPGLSLRDTRFGRAVVLTLATRELKSGDYVIALFGHTQQQGVARTSVDSYHFRIE